MKNEQKKGSDVGAQTTGKQPLPVAAWVYLLLVIAAGSVATAWIFGSQPIGFVPWSVFFVLIVLAVLAQFYEFEYDERLSYYPHTVFFFAGVVLLPSPLFLLLVVIPHLIEWIIKRLQGSILLQSWYIQPFNMATHVLAGLAAHAIYHSTAIRQAIIPANFATGEDIFSAHFAIIIYILINHALVGQALVVARRISWQDSRVMHAESLLMDMVMASLGYLLSVLWIVNPWLLIPFILSLLLLSQALMVPQLKKEVKTDPKTGLLNAKHFQKQFELELHRAQGFQRPLSLILADLDLLRNINNEHGHLAGDAVIQGVAELIQAHVREYDIAGRFGGEEFAILLPEAGPQEARLIADRLRRAVQQATFSDASAATPLHVTMSLGVASYPGNTDSVDQMIAAADTALYQAKYQGRNAVVMAEDIPHSDRVHETNLLFRLQRTETQDEEQHGAVDAEPVHTMVWSSTMELDEKDGASASRAAAADAEQKGVDPASINTIKRDVSSSSEPILAQNSSVWLWPFVGLVIAAGGLVTGFSLLHLSTLDFIGVGIFVLLAAFAEANQFDLFEDNTVSLSITAAVAAAILGGLPGAVLVSATIALVHYLKMHPAWYKSFFNGATHLLAALPAALFVPLLGIELGVSLLPSLTLLTIPVLLLVFLIETGLMAIAAGLAQKTDISLLWQERFLWLGPQYLALGVIGLFLAVGYAEIGYGSFALFILPILVMYATQKMYVQRTRASVRELRRMNHELAQANAEITKANDEITRASNEIVHANHEIQRLNDQLFLILSKIIDARDAEVAGHAARVADYAKAVAAKLDLPTEHQEYIQRAALLHDIGKLVIPERLLYKSGKLSSEEYQAVKRHADMGAELLEASDGLRSLAPAVRHHHERWDGSGYPAGLKQEEIPLSARILALCDAVEVMTSGRPYEPPKSPQEIVEEIRRNTGTQFDPNVADVLIEMIQNQNIPHHERSPRHSTPPRENDVEQAVLTALEVR